MRRDPGIDKRLIAYCLATRYGLDVASVSFLPVGYDPNASVYGVEAVDGTTYFLKIRAGPVHEPGLLVPTALAGRGVPNILAPVRTLTSDLWAPLGGDARHTVVLYPFMRGENAMVAGLTDDQWREFGATLRAVHDYSIGEDVRGQVRVESFALPSAALVRTISGFVRRSTFEGESATTLAAFWRHHGGRIDRLLAGAERLGHSLRDRAFDLVLCHADIHAANVLVGDDDRIWLVDWDGPLIAPRERDLLFIVGSRIARGVTAREEDLFFEGYGPTEIDRDTLVYYRYERIIEDLGEFAKVVFLDTEAAEETRAEEARLAMRFFAPDGDIDRAETVPKLRWPSPHPA